MRQLDLQTQVSVAKALGWDLPMDQEVAYNKARMVVKYSIMF